MKTNKIKINSRIFIFLGINILLLLLLYNLPINDNAPSLCIYKRITGKDCFNCGMTRAFLSVLHLNFKQAYDYNPRVIIVFPYSVILYLYTWWKYIFRKFDKSKQKM